MVMRNNRLREGKDKDWDFMDDVEIRDIDIHKEIVKGLEYQGNISHLRAFLNGGTLTDLQNYIISTTDEAHDMGVDSGWESCSYEMYSDEDMSDKYEEGHEDGEEAGEEYGYQRGYEEAQEEYEGKYEEGKKDAYEKMWKEAYKKGYQAGEDRGYSDYLETVDRDVDYGYDDEDFDEHQ
jgi:hypothetical protein